MAVDMFLKLEGIDGESEDNSHKKEIAVLAWSWGMSNSGSAQLGGGAGSGKVNVQDLSLTKYIDASSPTLFYHCCSGKHIPKAQLTVRKSGDTPLEYLIIKFEDLMITAVSTGGSGGEDKLTENLTLNFAKFDVKYTVQNSKGGAGATPMAGWDIVANVKR